MQRTFSFNLYLLLVLCGFVVCRFEMSIDIKFLFNSVLLFFAWLC